jgi:hypothetical protein
MRRAAIVMLAAFATGACALSAQTSQVDIAERIKAATGSNPRLELPVTPEAPVLPPGVQTVDGLSRDEAPPVT